MQTRYEFHPREVEEYIHHLDARTEAVYRLAVQGLCERCRGDATFIRRTRELTTRFREEIANLLAEAKELAATLTAGGG